MDTLELIEETERTTFQKLYARFDAHAKLADLDPYVLRDSEGDLVPGAISVTMNDPAIFLNAVSSWIMGAKWQAKVEGKLPSQTQHLIETFLDDAFAEADERLTKQKLTKLLQFLALHICARGWIGRRWLWQVGKDENPYLRSTPIDMRWCSYDTDADGHGWVATHFWRTKGQIKKEYGIDVYGGFEEIKVTDWWDDDKEEVWIDKKLVNTNKHHIGYPPFVIVPAPEGLVLLDKNYMLHRGESIFFLNEKMYPMWNRIISIDVSLAQKALNPPYQRPTQSTEPASPYPGAPSTTYDIPPNEEFKLIEQPDVNMANRVSQTEIQGANQRGGVNNLDLGNVQQNTTAIWITEQTEIRNKVLAPRLQAIESFMEQSARMVIDQYQKGRFAGGVGRFGRQNTYKASELGEPDRYSISYVGMSRSRKQEIANMALFNASKELPMETRLTDVLQVDDPQGMIAKLDSEKAETAAPVLFFFRKARSLAREAENLSGIEAEARKLESMEMTRLGIEMIKQSRIMPQQPTTGKPSSNGQGKAESLMPLLSGGRVGMEGV